MTVARILADKGSSVVTVSPDRTLEEVIQILADKRIGALVVAHPDGAVAGIISERDIMRALAGHGGSAFDAPVSAHMTANVTTCGNSTTIEEVMALMTAGRFRHVPVCEGGPADRAGVDRRCGGAQDRHRRGRASGAARLHHDGVAQTGAARFPSGAAPLPRLSLPRRKGEGETRGRSLRSRHAGVPSPRPDPAQRTGRARLTPSRDRA